MKDAILLELARKWERDATEPVCENGAAEAQIDNAVSKGRREGKRECADTIRALVSLLGEAQDDGNAAKSAVRY